MPDGAMISRTLEDRLRSLDPGLLADIPPDLYISHLDSADTYASYRDTPPSVEAASKDILRRAGAPGLEIYHQLVLLRLIELFDSRAAQHKYPGFIRPQFDGQFQRILTAVSQQQPGPYLFQNDSFLKDLGICRQRLVPCGAQLIERFGAIPRSWLLKGGLRQCARVSRAIAKAGGLRPFFHPHTDRRQLEEFNPAGWRRFYSRAAALMRLYPEIRGIMGGSWWYDPQLAAVSPRLRYLREEPESAGAVVFSLGENEHNTDAAIAGSPERHRNYAEGRYRPRLYGIIWLRQDLMRFVEKLEPE